MAPDHTIALVEKVIRVVEALKEKPNGLPLQQIAVRTGYVKSSVHRILLSLKKLGYIDQASAGGNYRLGFQFLVLARSLAAKTEMVNAARPYLHAIVERFEESAYLAVLRGDRGVFVDVEEAQRDLRLAGPLFAEVHFHATAAGKAMAAFLPEDYRVALLHDARFTALTSHTKIDPSEVARDWEQIRKDGYAINDEETVPGAVYLAAPVFDSRARVCGSISIGMPKVRYLPRMSTRLVDHLKAACRDFSDRLKGAGYVHITGN
ncbi:MAG TPA: IclR family transcriptional regulator [Acidobacteriota bacterium]|nr:IclR family transcriptional regulator [Acidobacteriota bacterium]